MTSPEETTKAIVEMVVDEVVALDDPLAQRIVANAVVLALSEWATLPTVEVPVSKPLEPMTDEEARAFGRDAIRYGKYEGMSYRAIPRRYLAWLADQSRKTWQELTRYLHNPKVQKELEEEDPDDAE